MRRFILRHIPREYAIGILEEGCQKKKARDPGAWRQRVTRLVQGLSCESLCGHHCTFPQGTPPQAAPKGKGFVMGKPNPDVTTRSRAASFRASRTASFRAKSRNLATRKRAFGTSGLASSWRDFSTPRHWRSGRNDAMGEVFSGSERRRGGASARPPPVWEINFCPLCVQKSIWVSCGLPLY